MDRLNKLKINKAPGVDLDLIGTRMLIELSEVGLVCDSGWNNLMTED